MVVAEGFVIAALMVGLFIVLLRTLVWLIDHHWGMVLVTMVVLGFGTLLWIGVRIAGG